MIPPLQKKIDKIKIQTIFPIENYHTLTVDLFFFS